MPFTDVIETVNFALAGNATLTMESEKSGAHYTYRIEKCKNADRLFFVNVLTGPEEYRYIGVISYVARSSQYAFRTTLKSDLKDDALQVIAFKWIWSHLIDRQMMPPKCVIRHDNRCGKCGRQLTTPRSIDLGMGPECAKAAPAWLPRPIQ